MSNFLLGLIQLRRGQTVDRLSKVFQDGEPVLDQDENELYIGDNNTPGGVPVYKRANVVNTGVSVIADKDNHGNYTRFDGVALTYTFSSDETYLLGREYHGRNAGDENMTIVEDGTFVINRSTEGTLIVPPGGTFTIKIVGEHEADLFGITESL